MIFKNIGFSYNVFQFVLLPRLLWPLTIYEIGLSVVEKLERKVNRYTRKWLGLPPALSSVALYSRSTSLRLPLRSIVEEYKLSKIRTQWMLNNSADSRIREVKPLLRSGVRTPLKKEMSNFQARHSCRGKRLDCRSRPRRDEALSPGVDRKWQEDGFGVRVVADGCHHSGGADGTVGGQASIQQHAQSR